MADQLVSTNPSDCALALGRIYAIGSTADSGYEDANRRAPVCCSSWSPRSRNWPSLSTPVLKCQSTDAIRTALWQKLSLPPISFFSTVFPHHSAIHHSANFPFSRVHRNRTKPAPRRSEPQRTARGPDGSRFWPRRSRSYGGCFRPPMLLAIEQRYALVRFSGEAWFGLP